MTVRTIALTRADLGQASEIFLTNSIIGILPVRQLDDQRVGASAPGPLTRLLMGLYEAEVQAAAPR